MNEWHWKCEWIGRHWILAYNFILLTLILATNYAMSSLFNFYHCTRCSGLFSLSLSLSLFIFGAFSLTLFLLLSILHLLLSVCSLSAWVRACYTSYILFLTHTASKSYWIYHLASGYTQTHSMEFLPFTSLTLSLSLSLSLLLLCVSVYISMLVCVCVYVHVKRVKELQQ